MLTKDLCTEALQRALQNTAMANYPQIFAGFLAKGIPEADILPRKNIFTFNAWRALGRHVKKGEHGVHVVTWLPVPDKIDAETGEVTKGGARPKGATVFHISQTELDNTC